MVDITNVPTFSDMQKQKRLFLLCLGIKTQVWFLWRYLFL